MRVRHGLWQCVWPLVWLIAAAGSAAAQQSGSGSLPTISPVHEIEIPKGERPFSFAFSPDHKVGYLLVYKEDAIDIWAMAVHYWPEVLGAVVALIALAWLLCFIRVRRRRRVRGDPYCRGCNYHLIQQARPSNDSRMKFLIEEGARCPECGCDLRKRAPLRGRSMAYRIAPFTIPAAIAFACYLALFAAGVHRQNGALWWLCLDSPWVDHWATTHGSPWLLKWKCPISEVRRIRIDDGAARGTVFRRRNGGWTNLLVTPDGKSLFVPGYSGRLLRVSTTTGGVLGSVKVRDLWGSGSGETRAILGMSRDSRTVFFAANGQGARSQVVAWDFVDDKRTVVIDEEPSWGGSPRYLANADTTRIVSIPRWRSNDPTRCHLRVFDLPHGVSREFDIPISNVRRGEDDMSISQAPCLAPDGKSIYGNAGNGGGLVGIDVETGQNLGHVWAPPWRHATNCEPIMSHSGRLVFAGVYDGCIAVRDTVARDWVAKLKIGGQRGELVISPDDACLAILETNVLLFDLAPVRALLDKRTP
jgi:hypothetical protein